MSSQLTKQCLQFDERPPTPDHVKKFRRSTYLEPGRRFMHHGVVDDVESLNLGNKIFGVADNKFRDGAADLIRPSPLSEMARLNIVKSEKNYKRSQREPLGHSPERNTQLPAKYTQGSSSVVYSCLLPSLTFGALRLCLLLRKSTVRSEIEVG
jgi:hypothetical protein